MVGRDFRSWPTRRRWNHHGMLKAEISDRIAGGFTCVCQRIGAPQPCTSACTGRRSYWNTVECSLALPRLLLSTLDDVSPSGCSALAASLYRAKPHSGDEQPTGAVLVVLLSNCRCVLSLRYRMFPRLAARATTTTGPEVNDVSETSTCPCHPRSVPVAWRLYHDAAK